jgi:hypothetical protein
MRPERTRLLACAAATTTVLLYAAMLRFTGAGVVDDTYIFLRYARNISAGAGPVFNIGEPVEGYTSPLWLAMLTVTWPLPVARETARSIEMREARAEVQRARGWASVGRWCAGLPPGLVASLTVGAIPFYCDRTTIDLLGLVDAHVARHGHVHAAAAIGHQKYASDYIVSRAPRYIIFSNSGQFRAPLLDDGRNLDALLPRTNYAMLDLVSQPAVRAHYEYRAERLADGTWVEFLELRHPDGAQ